MEGWGEKWTYLQETQNIVGLFNVTRGDTGVTKLGGKGSPLPQCPLLNGSGEEGRRPDFLPQIETELGQRRSINGEWRTYVVRFQKFST